MTRRTTRKSPRGWWAGPALVGLLVTTLLVGWSDSAAAAVVEYASLSDLAELSDAAVRGEVVEMETSFRDEEERIVTHVEIEVRETYMGDRGDIGERVEIEQWGGTYRGTTVRVPGDASFDVGEEVVVFLRRGDDRSGETYFLTALAQSKYTVQRGPETPLVSRDLSQLTFTAPNSGEMFEVEGRVEPLESFEARIRSLVDDESGGSR